MVDRVFVDMNFNDIQGASKGFIMKIDPTLINAQVLVIDPDVLPEGKARICSVNDMEINSEESAIFFTGVTAEEQFVGNIHPMVGMIDMNLTTLWCNVYDMTGPRFSGVDVELGNHETSVFVLMNSSDYPFSIMELDTRGNVIQQPESYELSIGRCYDSSSIPIIGAARGHVLHYTESNGLEVTGNVYVQVEHDVDQHLFSYNIPVASNLRNGSLNFGSYSCDLMPLGSQPAVTSWWAPENSVYSNGFLSLVGYSLYNTLPVEHGYVYINTANFDTTSPNCYQIGIVKIKDLTTHQLEQTSYATTCQRFIFDITTGDWNPPSNDDCSTLGGKSSLIEEEEIDEQFWRYAGIDETGIHAYLNSENDSQYQISVYDLTGRKVCSESYTVKGQKYVHVKFKTGNQLYLINVSNGIQSETIKVSGVK